MAKQVLMKSIKKVKIALKIKLNPSISQAIKLNELFFFYRKAFNFAINYINDFYNTFERLDEQKKLSCDICNNEEIITHKKDGKMWCGKCFYMNTSFIGLRNRLLGNKNFKEKILQDKFPELSYSGIYQGVVLEARACFMSYLKKLEQRKKLIEDLDKSIFKFNEKLRNIDYVPYFYYIKKPIKSRCKVCNKKKELHLIDTKKENLICEECFRTPYFYQDSFDGKKRKKECFVCGSEKKVTVSSFEKKAFVCEKCITDYRNRRRTIRRKNRLINKDMRFPELKKDMVLFYTSGLAFFNKDYNVIVPDTINRKKMIIETKIGDYQKDMMDDALRYDKEKKEVADVMKATPKIIKKKNKFYLIYPYSKKCDIFEKQEDIHKYYRNIKPNVTVISFGLKRTGVYIHGDKKTFHKFKSGILIWKKDIREKNEKRIGEFIVKRYKGNNQKLKYKLRKLKSKCGNSLFRYVDRFNHYLSYCIVSKMKEKKCEILIIRDMQRIKQFNYMGLLRKRLNQWAISDLQEKIKYKSNLNDISVFRIKYSDTKNLKCSKCGADKFWDLSKDELKKKKSNKKQKFSLLTKKLGEDQRFRCDCGYENDLLFNDCKNLHSHFIEWERLQASPKIKKTKQELRNDMLSKA